MQRAGCGGIGIPPYSNGGISALTVIALIKKPPLLIWQRRFLRFGFSPRFDHLFQEPLLLDLFRCHRR
jgi:hypothetical protein